VKAIEHTSKPAKDDAKEMSFIDHLEELRTVLIQSAAAFIILTAVAWFFSAGILDLLVRSVPVDSLYFQSPTEAFMVRMNISLVAGLMGSFPLVFFRLWAFISPALFFHERRKVLLFAVASTALFYAGAAFCYLVLIPVVTKFFLAYGIARVNPLISVNSYFNFVARLCFAFGAVFQLPIVVLVLSLLGVVTPRWLLRQWRYGVIIIFVAAAVLTPPDAISMMVMALPVLLLYALSIAIAFAVVRKKPGERE